MGEFIYMSATELARLIRSGKATSTEIVKDHLDRINKLNPTLNAVVIILADEALKTAAACDREAGQGSFRGPLHGVPMTVKEQFWLKGMNRFQRDLNKGFRLSMINYSETMGIRAGIIAEWEKYFENIDLLICPVSFGHAFKRCKPGTPIACDGKDIVYINYTWPYTACFNASGHPGMNIPLGINDAGLPLGVQVVGPYWSEPGLIHFAGLVSDFTEGFVRPVVGKGER